MSRTNAIALTRPDIRKLEGDHIYVLNTSDRDKTTTRAELLITVPTPGAPHGAITVRVPNTWIPIDLTSQTSVLALKDNRDFWHHINKKDIKVIRSEDAEEILAEEDAQEEYNRVYDIKQEDTREPAMFEVEASTNPYDRASEGMKRNLNLSKGNLRKEEGSTKVLAIMNKEDINENMKLASLKNIQDQLKENDYKYIIKTAKAGDFDRLKSWASTCLASL